MSPPQRLPSCPVCNEPVELRNAKTDGTGNAVHDDCYLRVIANWNQAKMHNEREQRLDIKVRNQKK